MSDLIDFFHFACRGASLKIQCAEHTRLSDEEISQQIKIILNKIGDGPSKFFDRYFQPPTGQLPSRRLEWLESRRCLLKLLGASRVSSVSLTHALHASAAAVLELEHPGEGVFGLGIDMEQSDRRLSPRAENRVRSFAEERLGLSGLECWLVKEACVKANGFEHHSMVGDFEISTSKEDEIAKYGICRDKNLIKEFEYKIFNWREWKIAYALARENGI